MKMAWRLIKMAREHWGVLIVAALALIGAAVMGLATQDRRKMRKTVHKLAKGAERTLVDLDKAVQQMHW